MRDHKIPRTFFKAFLMILLTLISEMKSFTHVVTR